MILSIEYSLIFIFFILVFLCGLKIFKIQKIYFYIMFFISFILIFSLIINIYLLRQNEVKIENNYLKTKIITKQNNFKGAL
jgi:hypothetical protein